MKNRNQPKNGRMQVESHNDYSDSDSDSSLHSGDNLDIEDEENDQYEDMRPSLH